MIAVGVATVSLASVGFWSSAADAARRSSIVERPAIAVSVVDQWSAVPDVYAAAEVSRTAASDTTDCWCVDAAEERLV